ncbi:hypothetical protein WM24_23805 [Burkholderia ubonensis]|nr:hypothetical protein WM24_23805 [Burkholderia ubonensis]
MAISESVGALSGYDRTQGGTILQAMSVSNITGFSVFNNAYSYLGSPQSPVPMAVNAGATVAFFRMGSGIRIPVAMDPSMVSLAGGLINQQVSWDFNNQVLQPYDASTATVSVTSITSSYSNGVYTCAVVAAAATNVGAVGDAINISGVTGTGAALVNGNQVVTSFTDNQHFSFQITAASGAIATGALSGTIVLNEGTGALPVKIIDINAGNSMTVSYNATTGAATWNRSGYTALIQI